jgi:isopenicillin N synthase-like dioxygenase
MSSPITIPVIDISGYLAGDKTVTASIATAISSAAQSPGFLQITGHGVPPQLTSKMLERLAAFFALPIEKKVALHRNNSAALRGFEAVGEQQLEKDFVDSKEGFMIGPEKPADGAKFLQGPNQWPTETEVPGLRESMMEYFGQMQKLSKTMFRLIALGLDLDEKYFDNFVESKDCMCPLRVLK